MFNLSKSLKTVFRKVSPISCPEVCIIGDPIVDIYLEPNKNKICDGGALNVINNYKYFSGKTPLVCLPDTKPYFYYHKKNNRNYTKIKNKENFYDSLSKEVKAKKVIISDYNKGFVNKQIPNIIADIVVVDSKYNTFNLESIKNVKTKVLHISKKDKRNKSFLKSFDYIIETNDKDKIFIFNSKLNLIAEVLPPEAISICDSGAGDTFVAVLAECLELKPTYYNLVKSVKIAAYAATDVVKRPYTSITTLKKANICTSLTLMS
jgi:bifunctional ADP-heptose synthase (sugar kinase/adenylyltransferase)